MHKYRNIRNSWTDTPFPIPIGVCECLVILVKAFISAEGERDLSIRLILFMRKMAGEYANIRKYRVIAIIAFILIIIGIIGIFSSLTKNSDHLYWHLPPGSEYYDFIQVPSTLFGHVEVRFYDVSYTHNNSIKCSVYDSDQYEEYCSSDYPPSCLYSVSGINRQFSIDLPTMSTYYIVFEHGPGYESHVINFSVHYTVTGIVPNPFVLGLVALSIGIILFIVSRKKIEGFGSVSSIPID